MTMKKYLDLFEAAPMPTAMTAMPAVTPVTTAKPIPTSTGLANPATVKPVKPGDVSSYVGGPVDATNRVPDTSKAIPGTQSKVVNNPMQDFEEDIEEAVEEDLAEMMRLSGLQLNEKAVSKQQQKFMGMVHAMQKGEKVKGASAELKKAAKGMSKKAAKDFASTKHSGLPKQVTEDVMLDEGGNALRHITNRFKHEVKSFMNNGNMAENLYDALYDYYLDTGEMPYGIAKAREGDPYAWVEERFYADMGSGMSEAAVTEEMGQHDTLSELARLAGLEEDGPGAARLYKDSSFGTINPIKSMPNRSLSGVDKSVEPVSQFAADLGMPPLPFFSKKEKSDYDVMKARKAERDFQQSGSAYKDDSGIIYGKDGNPRVQPALPAKDYFSKDSRARDLYNMQFNEGLNECGDMDMEQEDSFNVSTNMSSDGTKDVTINARGDRADELLQMLKMAGMRPHDDHEHMSMSDPAVVMIGSDEQMMDEERETEYANTPEEEYQTVDSIIRQGNDLNREKQQNPIAGFTGDNPLAEQELDEELSALLDSILVREEEPKTWLQRQPDRLPGEKSWEERVKASDPNYVIPAERPYKDEKTGRMITPPKGATNPPADSEFPPGDKRNMMPSTPRKK
jgi:hypothetical protein